MTSQNTLHVLTAFAIAAKAVLQDKNTPKILRDKLARLAAELRDSLAENEARAVDGAEAEMVILAYADSLSASQLDEDVLQSRSQTLLSPEPILGDREL